MRERQGVYNGKLEHHCCDSFYCPTHRLSELLDAELLLGMHVAAALDPQRAIFCNTRDVLTTIGYPVIDNDGGLVLQQGFAAKARRAPRNTCEQAMYCPVRCVTQQRSRLVCNEDVAVTCASRPLLHAGKPPPLMHKDFVETSGTWSMQARSPTLHSSGFRLVFSLADFGLLFTRVPLFFWCKVACEVCFFCVCVGDVKSTILPFSCYAVFGFLFCVAVFDGSTHKLGDAA